MSAPRRLLAISSLPPWPLRGGFALRAAHLLERLARDWDISLVVASEMTGEPPWPRAERHEVACVPIRPPLRTVPRPRDGLDRLAAVVGEVIDRREPDAALLFPGTEFLALESRHFPRTVVDRIDCGTLERRRYIRRATGLRGLKAAIQSVAERRHERRICRELDAVVVVGEDDADALRRLAGNGHAVHVVHNGVERRPDAAFTCESARPTVAFSGTLSYYANVDAVRFFARRIWPAIRAAVPNARFRVVGRGSSAEIERLRDWAGVEVVGDVPDMFETLEQAWVTVAPMRCGAGVKNKVLESWAVGRPAVVTPLGANGLALDDMLESLVLDDPRRFAERVTGLLRDRELRHRLGRHAQEHVRRTHTWDDAAGRISELLSG